MTGLQHTINMDGRDEFIEGNAQHGIHSQGLHEQDSISGTEGGVRQRWGAGAAGGQSQRALHYACCLVCIDRAVFASIEDSDSEHGDDSSSNTSTDDLMSAKRTPCRLQGAGVKEVITGELIDIYSHIQGIQLLDAFSQSDLHTPTWSQPREVTASSSGVQVRRLAQGPLDTRTLGGAED